MSVGSHRIGLKYFKVSLLIKAADLAGRTSKEVGVGRERTRAGRRASRLALVLRGIFTLGRSVDARDLRCAGRPPPPIAVARRVEVSSRRARRAPFQPCDVSRLPVDLPLSALYTIIVIELSAGG